MRRARVLQRRAPLSHFCLLFNERTANDYGPLSACHGFSLRFASVRRLFQSARDLDQVGIISLIRLKPAQGLQNGQLCVTDRTRTNTTRLQAKEMARIRFREMGLHLYRNVSLPNGFRHFRGLSLALCAQTSFYARARMCAHEQNLMDFRGHGHGRNGHLKSSLF
jgi:hypothetical protein